MLWAYGRLAAYRVKACLSWSERRAVEVEGGISLLKKVGALGGVSNVAGRPCAKTPRHLPGLMSAVSELTLIDDFPVIAVIE